MQKSWQKTCNRLLVHYEWCYVLAPLQRGGPVLGHPWQRIGKGIDLVVGLVDGEKKVRHCFGAPSHKVATTRGREEIRFIWREIWWFGNNWVLLRVPQKETPEFSAALKKDNLCL